MSTLIGYHLTIVLTCCQVLKDQVFQTLTITMELWWLLLLVMCVLLVLANISTRLNYIAKFAYLTCAYMTVSTIIIPFCLLRPRHPQNGSMTAKLLQYINRLVLVTYIWH